MVKSVLNACFLLARKGFTRQVTASCSFGSKGFTSTWAIQMCYKSGQKALLTVSKQPSRGHNGLLEYVRTCIGCHYEKCIVCDKTLWSPSKNA